MCAAVAHGECQFTTESNMIEKISLAKKFELILEHWRPRIVAAVNDFHVRLVKFEGPFVWHHHESEDELFLVVKGRMHLKLREGDIELNEGEFIVVPHGIEHLPVGMGEVHVLMFEPSSTLNTGTTRSERTVAEPEWI